MFVEIPNENFEEELKEKMKKNKGQHVPPPVDIIYYYVIESVVTITVGPPSRTASVSTRFTCDRELLTLDRLDWIRRSSSNTAFPPTDDPVEFERIAGANKVEYRFSAIQYRPRPLRHPRPSGRAVVESISGRF